MTTRIRITKARTFATLAVGLVVFAAGSRAGRVSAIGNPDTQPYDISGDWQWSEQNILTVPGYGAAFLGLQEEGPTLHFECVSGGTMNIEQDGNTFTATVAQSGECFTQRGQGPFYPFPSTLDISGSVNERSIFIDFGDCEYRGHLVIAPNSSTVRAIAATGNCDEIFTPASFKNVNYTAIRPH